MIPVVSSGVKPELLASCRSARSVIVLDLARLGPPQVAAPNEGEGGVCGQFSGFDRCVLFNSGSRSQMPRA